MSVEINVVVKITDSTYAYEWDPIYPTSNSYELEAKQALDKLEEGYSRVRTSILAGMKPTVKDDRPPIEHRNDGTVDSGPVSLRPVRIPNPRD